ncbi:MAG TPA: hypothetical protein VLD65_11815 [Anaerolineales bacterium]|nr:hypothetical protein [Anaerolineales bacterium]
MSENRPIWINWARTLQHWGINKGVASLLDSAGSLSVILAQLLYLSQPLLSGAVSHRSLDVFARTLENPTEREEFVLVLREGAANEPAA